VEADLQWHSEADAGLGLMFDGSADLETFFLVTLDTVQREWIFWTITPGGESYDRNESAVIHPGTANNHLRIIRGRDMVQVEINGVKVGTLGAAEPQYKSLVGIAALANESGSSARFDDFRYSWRPSN
jgi:hypothetical protein